MKTAVFLSLVVHLSLLVLFLKNYKRYQIVSAIEVSLEGFDKKESKRLALRNARYDSFLSKPSKEKHENKQTRVSHSEEFTNETNQPLFSSKKLNTEDILSLGNKIPEYPYEAIKNKISGVVKINIQVDDSGRVLDSKINSTSGYRILDLSALETSRDWVFPKEFYSKKYQIDIEFILKD